MIDFDIWSSSSSPRAHVPGEPAHPRMTAFPAAGVSSGPAFVVFPGGGYATHAAHEAAPVASWLSSQGIAAFVLFYRVNPDRHPLPLRDGHRAVRWVRHHATRLAIDPAQIGVIGFSAGGHLAACVATGVTTGIAGPRDAIDEESSAPTLMALCYPVISFEESAHRTTMENLLGPKPDRSTRRALSPELHATASSPPTFLWHTAEDEKVDVANSLRFARALTDCSVPVELHVFPQGRHGLGLALNDPAVGRWTGLFESWLRAHGWVAA